MDHPRNRALISLLGAKLIIKAAKITKGKRIRFTALQHGDAMNRKLFRLFGKKMVDEAIKIAGNERIRFSALLHESDIMDIEKALDENKKIAAIAGQVSQTERNIRRHRDK